MDIAIMTNQELGKTVNERT